MDTTMDATMCDGHNHVAEDLLTLPYFDSADEDLPTTPETSENETAFPVPDEGMPVTLNPLGGCKNTSTFKRPLVECPSVNLACSGLGKRGRQAPQAARAPTVAQAEPPRRESSAPVEQPEGSRTPLAANPASSAPVTPPGGPTEKLASSAMKTSQIKKSVKIEQPESSRAPQAESPASSATVAHASWPYGMKLLHAYSYVLLSDIPYGPHLTKRFCYNKYGGQQKAEQAAIEYMKGVEEGAQAKSSRKHGQKAQAEVEEGASSATAMKPMCIERHSRKSVLLRNIPYGPPWTKSFSYNKYGGQQKAEQAAIEHMKEVKKVWRNIQRAAHAKSKQQPSTASSPPA